MHTAGWFVACGLVMAWLGAVAIGQQAPTAPDDPAKVLVARLDLERYKATIKALTQFGDRRQGTDRNRAAVDWIDAQLKSYGCATERLHYVFTPPPPTPAPPARAGGPPNPLIASGEVRSGQGGSRYYGVTRPTQRSNSAEAQPDVTLRALNAQPSAPGPREQVYCTKIGAIRPGEMYIVGAHMDGIGFGEAANDDGSGTALVMEIARLLSSPDVQTERSIRFVLWNNEETGLNGARAYVEQRAGLQGKEDPVRSGRYPEPRWLAMIQHDMMLWDHGMPRADEAMKLAFFFRDANEKYATDYPAAVGSHMTNTDSIPFMDVVPSISLRENERGMHTGAGWNPHWHQTTDRYVTFSDKDFRLGLNAAQTTLGAVAQLAGATLKQ